MGNMQQIGWAESGLDMEIALSASFASNFHPPLPQELVAPTAEAIRLCADCYDDEETLAVTYVSLPTDLPIIPRSAVRHGDGWQVLASDLVDATHTWPFVIVLVGEDTD